MCGWRTTDIPPNPSAESWQPGTTQENARRQAKTKEEKEDEDRNAVAAPRTRSRSRFPDGSRFGARHRAGRRAAPRGTLIFGGETEWGFLDPHIDASGATHRVNYQLFEGLFWRDYTRPNDGSPPPIIPQLATGYEVSDDGLVYTVSLREGVKFHDGTPFNADAVVFNVRRVWDESFEHYYDRTGSLKFAVWRDLAGVETVDEYTVKFTLSKPFAFFIDQLAEPTGVGIPVYMSPESIRKWGNEEVEQHPVGTGPFRFVERVRGQRIVYERNPEYWNQPYPYLDRIIWRPIPEPSTRVNALVGGEVDMIAAVPPDNVEQLAAEGMIVAMGTPPHIWWLNLNHSELPFSDVRVRQAANHAIDKQGMAEKLLRGTALPAFSMVSRTSVGFDPEWTDPYPYDPERAKALLAEAGYPDGFKTTLQTSPAGSGQILPVAMARVDPARPRQGGHPGQPRDLRVEHLCRHLGQRTAEGLGYQPDLVGDELGLLASPSPCFRFAHQLGPHQQCGDRLVLPAFTAALVPMAVIFRLTRSGMMDELAQQYVPAARARGLNERSVVLRHAVRNILAPIVNISGLQIGVIFGTALFSEVVFSWPGVGLLVFSAIGARDVPVIQAVVLFTGLLFVIINLIADITQALLDPRTR